MGNIKQLVWDDDDTLVRVNTVMRYLETILHSERDEKRVFFEKYLPVIVYLSMTGMI